MRRLMTTLLTCGVLFAVGCGPVPILAGEVWRGDYGWIEEDPDECFSHPDDSWYWEDSSMRFAFLNGADGLGLWEWRVGGETEVTLLRDRPKAPNCERQGKEVTCVRSLDLTGSDSGHDWVLQGSVLTTLRIDGTEPVSATLLTEREVSCEGVDCGFTNPCSGVGILELTLLPGESPPPWREEDE